MSEVVEIDSQSTVQITDAQKLTLEEISEIRQLTEKLRHEIPIDASDPLFEDRQDYASLFGQGLKMAKSIENGTYDGFIIKAVENGKLVGFSLVTMKEDKEVVGTFTGVEWSHKGLGIGSKLLHKRHEELKSMGVNKYQTNIWEGSQKMFDRAGIKYTVEEDNYDGGILATIYL